MTSTEIRQAFLDFFREKNHTVVPSSSLMPDSPNLLFTNAGMNQFVPIFLNEVPSPYVPGRAADTQKCIRAGGKHNDLDDVGLDTYHHTFFEMLGNWSFGDYFKKEAIEWAWELIVERFKFPPQRVYATIYQPDPGDPSERDQEAWELWAAKFRSVGLDPDVHIVNGNKKDNFWMMGETGPCGPCSEIHIDLTPDGGTRGALVNKGSAECIEIWNNVFIQFNANPDGTFTPLPAQHVDTGMGFERLTSIIQGTKGFTDFANAKISNYETDIFRPIFDELEKMSGHRYGSTLPQPNAQGQVIPTTEQEKVDVAFRVIADHIRTLSFAIADGIQPGNTDRNYVLRRILRRAVRYGRSLSFQEPFFYKLAAVLARTMGDVFPEIRAKQKHVEEVLKREEEAFNKTLDKGIALFESEAAALTQGSARAPRAVSGASPETSSDRAEGATYSKRNLPHFERPWAKYMVTFSTKDRQPLSSEERSIVMASVFYPHDHHHYELYAVCVMPDHVHLLFEPQIKAEDADGKPIFYSLTEIMQGIKSTTAHRINKLRGVEGAAVWDKESFDRMIRSDSDLEEKFLYVTGNPWNSEVVASGEEYSWVWWPQIPRRGADESTRGACAPQEASTVNEDGVVSGAFAFRLYDEQGFPLDLTGLMARERGLTVDTDGFEKLMEEQRTRARAAQKKQVIELSEIETKEPTTFVGYDMEDAVSEVREVVAVKGKTAVIVAVTPCYAEMGGQVGDTGALSSGGRDYPITNTIKVGSTWLHYIEAGENEILPVVGTSARVLLDKSRRGAIQRHHSVTHLLHWALHEVVSHEATQKGSFVGPDKLTFDFNSAALTLAQVRDIERLVNERIVENAGIIWNEVPYADVKGHPEIMQFFGDKYGETVRLVDIGGYSKELCAGTHARATGEIGLFRIFSEAAIASGVRRIEAVAGLEAFSHAVQDAGRLATIAAQINSPVAEIEKKIDALLASQKEAEKALKAARLREAAARASDLGAKAQPIGDVPTIIVDIGNADGDELQAIADALKGQFAGVVVLAGVANGAVSLIATVSPDFTSRLAAGKIIQTIAPLVGGRGGGKPDAARGGGKEVEKISAALEAARAFVAAAK